MSVGRVKPTGAGTGRDMKLSACVIVKNEAANLPKWLECMGQVADEMIVADTGSTDDTVAIAEAAGAKVCHFDWCSDFAAAKNYALEHATGDWILFLDADEYFSSESLGILRREMVQYHRDRTVGIVLCRLINIDKDNNNKIVDTMLQGRIFRNLPHIRYKGCIHEQLSNTKGNMKMVCNNRLIIYHTGYAATTFQLKARRNLVLLKEKLAAAKTQEEKNYLSPYLMDAYHSLEDYEKAVQYARQAIDARLRLIGMEGSLYETLFSASQRLGKSREELFAILDEAMEVYPDEAAFIIEKGYLYWQSGELPEAEQCMLRGLELRKRFERKLSQGQFLTDNSLRLLPYAYQVLGDIAYRRKDLAAASDYFFRGLQEYKYSEALLAGLLDCIGGNEPAEIVQLLNTMYSPREDAVFLVNALKGKADKRVLLYYAGGDGSISPVKKYLLADRFDAAAVEAAANIRRLAGALICGSIRDSLKYNRAGQAQPADEYAGLQAAKMQENKAMLQLILSPKHKELVNSGQPERDSFVGREVLRRLAAMDISAGAECYLDNRQYPLVSIMIPTYNRPDLFEQTLQSALAQTYPNVEILVTDNSTNEDTRLLMEKYVEDVRIRYFRNRDARSKADNFRPFEQMARGEYLQWCMDDDVLAPNKLAVMVPVLRDNPGIALVTSQRGVIDAEGNILPEEAVQLMESGAAWQCYGGRDVGRVMLSGTNNFIGEPSAVLFRRRDLQHHYWAADCRGYKAVSDVAMWLELLEKGDMVVFRESLSYYRRHDSQEGQQPEVVLLSRMEWNRLLDEYADRQAFLDGAALRQGKLSLWQDYQKIREYPSVQQAGNFAAYRACMEAIGSQYGK